MDIIYIIVLLAKIEKFSGYLPFNYQRAIQTAIIEAYIINPGTPERIKQDIFLRINPDVDKLSVWKRRRFYYGGAPMQFMGFK